MSDISVQTLTPEPFELNNPIDFTNALLEKGIPVDADTSSLVADRLYDNGATPLFMGRLANSFNFISKPQFEVDLDQQAQIIKANYADKPFNIMINARRNKSPDWIISQLTERGVPNPQHYFESFDNTSLFCNLEALKDDMLIVDEWSFSGDQVATAASQVYGVARYGEDGEGIGFVPKVEVYLLYDNDNSSKSILKTGANMHTLHPKSLTTLNTALPDDDKMFLHDLSVKYLDKENDPWIRNSSTLTFGWWRVPDNFYSLFAKPSPFGLIDPEKYFPPYKNRTQYEKEYGQYIKNRLIMPF